MIGALSIIVVIATGGLLLFKKEQVEDRMATQQAALAPFYAAPDPIPAEPGTLIRSEVMSNVTLRNGTAHRVLYTSLDSANQPVAVGGMVFVPTVEPPAGHDRKVVAWAHPTVGLADQCAPSRAASPLMDTDGWLGLMLDRGWVVTATDYYGLGTAGPKTYLIGQQEAKDVVNSVRAARNLGGSAAGTEWTVWGHSQGGHSALWTASLAAEIAPELKLLAVGAAAPAQQLLTIIEQQWETPVGWVIGTEAVVSFQDYYRQFQILDTVSRSGRAQVETLNSECVIADSVRATVSDKLDGAFFASNPLANPQWVMIAKQQTPPMPPKGMPMFMSEGTKDQVVLAGTNARMQQVWCSVGVNMTADWLGDVGHMAVANASGPSFVEWAADRFAGKSNRPNCSIPPASPPLPEPKLDPAVEREADALLRAYPLPPLTP